MTYNLLDYIILTLVFAVMIGILLQLFGNNSCDNEYMTTQLNNKQSSNDLQGVSNAQVQSAPYTQVQSAPYTQELNNNANSLFDVMQKSSRSKQQEELINKSNQEESNKSNQEESKSNQEEKNSSCPVDTMDQSMDQQAQRYIKEVVMGGRFQNLEDYEEYKSDDIQTYQNDFFGFQNKVNKNSSAEMVDPVDKMNELKVSNGSELNNLKDKPISEVFNGLMQNTYYNSRSNEDVIQSPVDKIQQVGMYVDDNSTGKSYKKYDWQYKSDSENVNNGGKFYDNIEASDSEYDNKQLW